MKKILVFLLGIISLLSKAQNPTFQWAKNMGGTSANILGKSIAVDVSGNVYTIGYFVDTVDFDPGAGTFNLTSAGNTDIFITKLDVTGSIVWAKRMGGSNGDIGTSIAVDASGNVYFTGYFQGTADFDPGAGTVNLTSAGTFDIFVSKLDASGNFAWAQKIGGTTGDGAFSIAVDAFSNVYTTGNFSGTVDFDPGAGTFNLNAAGPSCIFISKLNSSGNFVWAKNFVGNGVTNSGNSIVADAFGNVYTTGHFTGIADFDPGTGTVNLTGAGSSEVFISKLDASGNYLWAKKMGGGLFDGGKGIDVDASGNVYTTGYFTGTVDFDPGTGIANLTSAGGIDIFISKLDASGNYSWSKSMGGTLNDIAYALGVDLAGNVYTTGAFQGTSDFDPGAGSVNYTSAGGDDIFISELNASGDFVWAEKMGGAMSDAGNSLVVDITGNIYTTGNFQNTVDFDPGAGTFNLTSAGGTDLFVHKMNRFSPLPIELLSFTAFTIGKNEVQCNWITTTESNNDYFTLERSTDGSLYEKAEKIDGAGNSTVNLNYSFTDKNPYAGISYYRLKQTDFNGDFTYSKIVSVKLTSEENSIKNAFPNPFINSTTIELNEGIELNKPKIQLMDDLGKDVIKSIQIYFANNQIQITRNNLKPGVYYFLVSDANDQTRSQIKLIVQ